MSVENSTINVTKDKVSVELEALIIHTNMRKSWPPTAELLKWIITHMSVEDSTINVTKVCARNGLFGSIYELSKFAFICYLYFNFPKLQSTFIIYEGCLYF